MKHNKTLAIIALTILTASLIGCVSSEKTAETEQEQLSIYGFEFISGEHPQDQKQYEEHSKTYGANQNIYFYFQLKDYKEQSNNAHIKEQLIAKNPDGKTYMNKTLLDSILNTEKKNYIWLKNYINPPSTGFAKGEHSIKIKIKDKFTNETVTYTDSFEINNNQQTPST